MMRTVVSGTFTTPAGVVGASVLLDGACGTVVSSGGRKGRHDVPDRTWSPDFPAVLTPAACRVDLNPCAPSTRENPRVGSRSPADETACDRQDALLPQPPAPRILRYRDVTAATQRR